MAQAAPAPGGMPRTTRPAVTTGPPPNVFDERTHRIGRLVAPVLLGLVYGYWAAANRRSGGPITGWNLLFGFVTAVVFAAVLMALLAFAPRLRRELHALAWTAFYGCSFGFLYSQAGESILRSIGMSLVIAAVTFAVLFYHYYTREDAAGHRVG
ncbi:hypothetical protein [Streptomyces sp. IBSBF 3136]|uniref:hypothetical protein n=1 Tax=Streptomyces sp. IBSBF 3136 TaxID=2903524 RepID=UPI002FDC6BB5